MSTIQLIAVAASVLLAPGNSPTADSGSPGTLAATLASEMTAGLTTELALTPDQVPQVEAALRQQITLQVETFQGFMADPDPEAIRPLRKEMEAARAEAHRRLEPVLDAKQLAGFNAAQQRERAKIGSRVILSRLQEPLHLSDDQMAQLAPIVVDNLMKRQAIVGDVGEERPSLSELRAMRSRSKKLQKELEAQLEPILSEEQMKAFRQHQKETRNKVKKRMRERNL